MGGGAGVRGGPGVRGDIILGWLVKLIVSLAIAGALAFEAGAIIVVRVGADNIANEAAGEAALAYGQRQSREEAEAEARKFAERSGARLVGFSVAGEVVSVTVEKRASTIFLHRIEATEDWGIARSTRRRRVV